MSLSPFDSFQSQFVTYFLNFPRIYVYQSLVCSLHFLCMIPVISRGYCTMEYSPSGFAKGGILLILQGIVAEHFWCVCFLGSLASVTGGP